MITKSLKQFASPIIDNAMATGGRSSTTTTTDYSSIGNALTQKAQNEFQMAQIKGDMALRVADITANNKLQIVQLDDARIKQENLDRMASRDMGTMEKVMGVIQGAASGAQTGMAVGGPKGAIVGGILGGAASAHSATSGDPGDEKRANMNKTNETLGGLATIATATRGMYNDYKGKEVYKNGMDNLGKLQQGIGAMGPGPQKDAAVAEYQAKMQSMNGELGKYMGPAEANQAMEGVRAGQSGLVSNDPETRRSAEMANIGVQMAADGELAANSPTRGAKLKQYHGQLDALNNQKYGYDGKHKVSPQEFSQFAGGVNPEYGRAVTDMYRGGGGQAGGGAPSANQVSGAGQANPRTGSSTGAPAYAQTAPVPTTNGIAGGTIAIKGAGVAMDDGGAATPTVSDLGKIGAEAAKTMEAGTREKTGRGGASGSWADDGSQKEEISPLDARIEKIRNSPLNKGLTEERVKDIAEYELRKEGVSNIDARADSPKLTKKLDVQRARSAELDTEVENEFKQLSANMIDKDDKDGAKNILITQDNLRKQEALIDRLPADSQVKAKAAEFLLNGLSEGKSKDSLLGSQFLLKGNVATVLGTGLLDTMRGKTGGWGKGSAKAVSAILSEDEIAAVEEYSQNEAMAIQALVKTGDKGVVNEGEVKHSRSIFFNQGMSKDRKQERINGMKDNMVSKMRAMRRTASPFKNTTMDMKKEEIDYRSGSQVGKAYEETMERKRATNDMEAQKEQVDEGTFFY